MKYFLLFLVFAAQSQEKDPVLEDLQFTNQGISTEDPSPKLDQEDLIKDPSQKSSSNSSPPSPPTDRVSNTQEDSSQKSSSRRFQKS